MLYKSFSLNDQNFPLLKLSQVAVSGSLTSPTQDGW